MVISMFHGYYPHFAERSMFRGYYPHFVDISAFLGNIHVMWILSAFRGYIRILWILSALATLRSTYLVMSVVLFTVLLWPWILFLVTL